jgi:hypothetical protein
MNASTSLFELLVQIRLDAYSAGARIKKPGTGDLSIK